MATEIAVDLDGTILKDAFPKLGEPIAENVQRLREWKDKGYKITIFTARIHKAGEEDKIREFFTANDIPFDKITNVKPYTATVFIDDRAIPVSYNEPWPADITNKVEEVISMHKKASIKQAMTGAQRARLKELQDKQTRHEALGGKLSDKELNELDALEAQAWTEERNPDPLKQKMYPIKKIQAIDALLKKANEQVLVSTKIEFLVEGSDKMQASTVLENTIKETLKDKHIEVTKFETLNSMEV